jgi:predicted Fe-Mo cluster-binding NifX family protein
MVRRYTTVPVLRRGKSPLTDPSRPRPKSASAPTRLAFNLNVDKGLGLSSPKASHTKNLAGTPSAIPRAMTVAVPVWQDRVSPVFDAASRLLIVRQQRGRELDRREFVLGALSSEVLAHSVVELHVDVLLCAAISEPLRRALERGGVHVESHLCGQVDALLDAFRHGNCRCDEFRMPGCWDRHEPDTRSQSSNPGPRRGLQKRNAQ